MCKKKRFQTWIGMAAIGLFLVCCAGCGDSGTEPKLLKEWTTENEAAEAGAQAAGRQYRVGMITDVGGVKDQGFNQSAWEGLVAYQEATGAKVDYMESGSAEEFVPNLTALAENGYTLCWGVGYQCADALLTVAEQYPNVNFAIIDNAYEAAPDNVTSVIFRAQEPSFVVGYIAASVSKTGKVGFVGGAPGEIIDQFQYGYQAGVQYANHVLDLETEVFVEYVGDFVNDTLGGQIADTMYENGCDIIYAAAGGAGLGVIASAGRTGNYVIGVDKDQSSLDPEHILTSGMKKVDVAIQRVSQDYARGLAIGGRILSFGMTEGAVGIPEHHENYSDEVYDAAIGICDRIKAGTLIPPANEKGYLAFVEGL